MNTADLQDPSFNDNHRRIMGGTLGIFLANEATEIRNITDGTSNTIMLAERNGLAEIDPLGPPAAYWTGAIRARWVRSAVLELSLDAAPALIDGIPINMGLFDIQGAITGQSGIFYSDSIDDGGLPYSEGAMVTATLGSSTYNWTISYTGNINWSDFDNSVVSSVTGPGTGIDIVLIGHSANVVGSPGDFDGDGDVDGRDFVVWQRGNSPSPFSATDLADWQNNYGSGPVGAIAAVPEPTTWLLGIATLLVSLARGRHS